MPGNPRSTPSTAGNAAIRFLTEGDLEVSASRPPSHRVHRATARFSEPHINVHTAHTELKNGKADSAIPLLHEVSAVDEGPSQAELARSRDERT